nr:hypothetical protein [Tanacetum cinerariifolium]
MEENYEPIILPEVEDLYAEEEEKPSEHPMFPTKTFEERFQMSRKLFTSIVEKVTKGAYFREKEDYTGRLGTSSLLKCTFTIRQLTYSTVPDALDEYLQMGQTTSRLSFEHFVRLL